MQIWLLSEVCFPHAPANLPNPIFGDLEFFASTSFMKMDNLCALFLIKNYICNFLWLFPNLYKETVL